MGLYNNISIWVYYICMFRLILPTNYTICSGLTLHSLSAGRRQSERSYLSPPLWSYWEDNSYFCSLGSAHSSAANCKLVTSSSAKRTLTDLFFYYFATLHSSHLAIVVLSSSLCVVGIRWSFWLMMKTRIICECLLRLMWSVVKSSYFRHPVRQLYIIPNSTAYDQVTLILPFILCIIQH